MPEHLLSFTNKHTTKELQYHQLSLDQYSPSFREKLTTIHFPQPIVEHLYETRRIKNELTTEGATFPGPRTKSGSLQFSKDKEEKEEEAITLQDVMVSTLFDRRLAPALSLSMFRQRLDVQGEFDHSFRVPFAWQAWIDLEGRLRDLEHVEDEGLLEDCQNLNGMLQDNDSADIDGYDGLNCDEHNIQNGLGFWLQKVKVKGPVGKLFSISTRRVIATSYLQYSAPIPERLMFLNIDDYNRSLVLPTRKVENKLNSLLHLASEYILQEYKTRKTSQISTGIQFPLELEALSKSLKACEKEGAAIHMKEMMYDDTRLVLDDVGNLKLNRSNFNLDLGKIKSELLQNFNNVPKSQKHTSLDYKFLTKIKAIDLNNPPKYFHEAILSTKRHSGSHYDWRFFNKAMINDYERQLILHQLTKAWLTFCQSAGIKSWLMHGTLLGYYFNGMNMPFDNDLDVVMTMDSLVRLAKLYNQTLVVDASKRHNQHEVLGSNAYLIDVNPQFLERTKGNGGNTIDARFIDIHSGLYIDITGIARTIDHKNFNKRQLANFQKEFNQMLDLDYLNKIEITTINQARYNAELDNILRTLIDNKEVFNCKNNHFYTLDELSPLKEVYFEGLKAYAPHNIELIMKREYNKGLYKYKFKNYIFRKQLRLWVAIEDCSASLSDYACLKNPKVEHEYNQTRDFTYHHEYYYRRKLFINEVKFKPPLVVRDDPWIMEFANEVQQLRS